MKKNLSAVSAAGTAGLSAKQEKALEKKRQKQEKYYLASQWQLMGRKLRGQPLLLVQIAGLLQRDHCSIILCLRSTDH